MIAAALLAVGSLQGCAWTALVLGPSNGVRPVKLASIRPDTKNAILVVGIRSEIHSKIPNKVVLSHYKPATNSAGDCGTYDRLEITLAPAETGPIYLAFSGPPGTWVFNYFNATSVDGPAGSYKGTFPAFVAPSGQVTYIGEFVLVDAGGELRAQDRARYRLGRDLTAAQTATGLTAMALADTAPDPNYRPIFCIL